MKKLLIGGMLAVALAMPGIGLGKTPPPNKP
jgi:hypothetical protein